MQFPNTFDENRRYVFTNCTYEEFVGYWAKEPHLISACEIRELPEYKAYTFCKHLVDRELHKAKASDTGDTETRRPLEEKTIRAIDLNEESPELVHLRAQIRKEVEEQLGVSAKVADSEPEAETVPLAKKKAGRHKKVVSEDTEFAGVEK